MKILKVVTMHALHAWVCVGVIERVSEISKRRVSEYDDHTPVGV